MIYKIPPVPKKIIDAVNDGTLAVFIGAGVSRLIGCKSWSQLSSNLVEICFSLTKKDGSKLISYKEKEILLKSKNYKKAITICYFLLKENGYEKIFYDKFKESLTADGELLGKIRIYDELFKLRALFITTNADTYFDKKFEQTRIIYKEKDFNVLNIDRNKLYKIHGTIGNGSDDYWNSLVFTVPEYIKRYNISNFKNFLKYIFNNFTVLFVGYGLEEFELLDFLITKFDTQKKYEELKHFILLPFYRGEENILEFENFYYNSMGIQVIAYEKDALGYAQLYEVMKEWNKEINKVSTYLYNTYEQIENVIKDFTQDKAEKVFQLIKNDNPQENYFFHQLAKTTNPFPWLIPLKEKGYFSPARNPKPYKLSENENFYQVPHWNILDYLENVAKKNMENPDEEITKVLLEIVNEIIDYKDERGERIDNYRTDWMMIKIVFSLPIEKITEKHIEFIKIALNSRWDPILISSEIGESVFPKLLEEKETALILKLLDVILSYKKKPHTTIFGKETYEYISIMDEYYLRQILRKYKPSIAELCAVAAAEIALEKIKSIIEEDESQFNSVWIPTIEDHPQTSFPDRYECQVVHFVRDMYEHVTPQLIKEKIKSLLNEKHPIFRRIAIHIVNYHYEYLNELFWNWKDNPLEDFWPKHEIYELLKQRCVYFTEEQIERVIGWIEKKDYEVAERRKEIKKKIIAYKKKEWLSALLETKNKKILSLYEKYNRINPAVLEHPGFDFWMEIIDKEDSPLAKKEILSKSNEEIIKLLNDTESSKRIDRDGIASVLKESVLEKPEKFTENIKPFLDINPLYQHALLCGFKEAWKSKKEVDWSIVFDFILELINGENFWSEKYKGLNYRNWIVSCIAEFIEDGTKNDNYAFEPDLFPKFEKILLLLVNETESDISDKNSLIFSVLNSTKGKVFSAIVNFSLRYARLNKEKEEDKWISKIKHEFTKRLDRNIEPSLEFSMILGEYLINLYWLDKNWVKNNINKIFLKHHDEHWIAAMTGYLAFPSSVYKDLYFLIRANNHYEKAINTEFDESHIVDRLVQHIMIGFFENWETLEDEQSLLFKLFENKNTNQLLAMVNFLWSLRDELTDKIKIKVKPLWRKLYELVKEDETNVEYQKVISNLSKWLFLIDEIDDEIFNWLKLTAKYVNKDFNAHFFVEGLAKYVDKTPEKVGEIFLEMLNSDIYPELEEHVQKIVSSLYEHSLKSIADVICNLYGENGYLFLKPLYDRYNKKEENTQS